MLFATGMEAVTMANCKPAPKSLLKLPDLEQSKSAVPEQPDLSKASER
jgi:hypothetical protein